MKKYKLILASGSPRRSELLSWTGLPFTVLKSNVEEVSPFSEPRELVADLARQKGADVFTMICNEALSYHLPMVISSDTIVCLEDEVLGKPKDIDQAREMLQKLSGKNHKVLTAVCLHYKAQDNGALKTMNFVEESEVEFQRIIPDVLEHYLESKDSLDKAGAYGIQAQALTFIKGLRGSYTNVMGFPLSEFVIKLKELVENEGFKNWREAFD